MQTTFWIIFVGCQHAAPRPGVGLVEAASSRSIHGLPNALIGSISDMEPSSLRYRTRSPVRAPSGVRISLNVSSGFPSTSILRVL